ncbi:hypothetical protein RD792_017169 [Penstemon davidsonii]|uniref:Glycosyltransferase n=1 Tax=Penstemon davidsonii TaxID=160366 RepID=A0ABR0CLA8_9LAMI|nr:hypothetical protein RD792_017169 [Penstemon davidsonii]
MKFLDHNRLWDDSQYECNHETVSKIVILKQVPSHRFRTRRGIEGIAKTYLDLVLLYLPLLSSLLDISSILVLSLRIQESCFNPVGVDTARGTTHRVLLRTKSPADLKDDRRKSITVPVVSFDADFPFQELTLKKHEKKSIDNVIEFLYTNVFEKDKDVLFVNFKLSCDVVLLKTTRGFEGKYIDYVSNECKKDIIPVGPLVSDASEIDEESSEILKWLNTKNRYSTLYISFGSEYFLSNEEIEEIAEGLELCGVNFIWVIRFPVGETVNIEEALPQGFLERVKERGKIVEKWAPQANILAHESTGGFMSHCGWSSINESVYFGVPVIGMPMRTDQFINVKMLGEARVCVEVVRNENEVFKGEAIAKAIVKVILDNFNGEEFRRRARELSEEMKIEEEQATDETAEQLWRLCLKNK